MKKYLLFIICLLLTGCSVSITSTVNNDGSVLETVEVNEYVSSIYLDDQTPSEYASDLLSVYKDTLDEEGYSYSSSVSDSLITVTLSKEFSNVCEYFNNSLFITSASNLSCAENDDGNYEINGDVGYFICGDDCMEPPLVDSATLTMNFQKSPLSSNATYINDNSYTWRFDSSSNTKINLVTEKSTTLSEAVNSASPVVWLVVVLLVVILIALIGFVLYRKYKRNRIEY